MFILLGIVGIVLIIGMVVDVNVLIFERIWEEVCVGWFVIMVIDVGYKWVFGIILDVNIIMLIVVVILF